MLSVLVKQVGCKYGSFKPQLSDNNFRSLARRATQKIVSSNSKINPVFAILGLRKAFIKSRETRIAIAEKHPFNE